MSEENNAMGADKRTDGQIVDEADLSAAKILSGYLSDYTPWHEGIGLPKIVRTSQEIAADLTPMVEIEINDISKVMARLGYDVEFNPRVGWLMARKPMQTTD